MPGITSLEEVVVGGHWRAPWRKGRAPQTLWNTAAGQIVCSDALDLLRRLRDESVDIVFLDPPFNLGKVYGGRGEKDDLRSVEEYRDYITRVLRRSVRVLKPGGALFLYHLPYWAFQFAALLEKRMTFRHWIAIAMKSGFARGRSLYPAHYALLYFSKGEPRTFSRPKLPISLCRHCEKPLKDYGGYKEYVSNGVNLSDFWDDLSPVRHSKYKTRDANELPIAIPQRVIAISGSPGDVLVDPFAGAGTSLVAARHAGLSFVGGDYERVNCDVMLSRLRASPMDPEL